MTTNYAWTEALERFVRQRLRDRSGEGGATILTNSQYVVDGIAAALADHPLLYNESFVALRNVIVQRGRDLRAVLGGPASRAASSAALNLYLAWCALDGACKAPPCAEFVARVASELPQLVEHMVLAAPRGASAALQTVAAEYQHLYWALVRSWVVAGTIPYETLAACGAALQAGLHEADNAEAPAEVDAALVAKALTGAGGAFAVPRGLGAGAVRVLLNDLFGARGAACDYCGVHFATAEQRSEHQRRHIYRRTVGTAPLRRLLPPTIQAFTAHIPQPQSGGYAAVVVAEDVLARRPSQRIALAAKRPRGD